jgi:hypothetical protein
MAKLKRLSFVQTLKLETQIILTGIVKARRLTKYSLPATQN